MPNYQLIEKLEHDAAMQDVPAQIQRRLIELFANRDSASGPEWRTH
jgi:hypothetical protein